jgi:SAM-dependent methyltransferase
VIALEDEWLVWPPVSQLLAQAERLVRAPAYAVPPSHRPVVGRAITAAKRLLVHGLRPVHEALLAPQQRFNEAALEAVRAALEGKPLPDGLASLAALPGALPPARALLGRQRAWNEAFVAALRAVGRASPDEAAKLHAPLATATPLARGPLFELLRPQAELDQALARLAWALLGLHRTSVHEYDGYRIPLHLLELTGAGPASWQTIAQAHLQAYARHTPIAADHTVLEIGCGVGRDAMHLAPLLERGSYVGVDITAPSIEWCQRNITPRFPNVRFVHLDVHSELYNPSGRLAQEALELPLPAASVDRIVLQSVFTHLFEPAVAGYLREFRRVLKPGGLAYASLFQVDEASLSRARSSGARLSFRHAHGDGCLVDSALAPEEAVGFTPEALARLTAGAGLRIVEVVPGSWPGGAASGYQDAMVLTPLRVS